ncbi:hypothetical protein FH5_04969 [Priestia endophytica]|nr:hypothetical protein FH5_04969 [Priestia endophytica]
MMDEGQYKAHLDSYQSGLYICELNVYFFIYSALHIHSEEL